jgi:hypothetical protein
MIREYFDVNKIIGIKHVYSREHTEYAYYPAQPEKRNFFGRVSRPALAAGFAEDIFSTRISVEKLREWNLVVIADKVYWPSTITVYLLDDCQVHKRFDNDPTAINWIKQLLSESQGKFQVVTHA